MSVRPTLSIPARASLSGYAHNSKLARSVARDIDRRFIVRQISRAQGGVPWLNSSARIRLVTLSRHVPHDSVVALERRRTCLTFR